MNIRPARSWHVPVALALVLLSASAPPAVLGERPSQPFAQAELFFELNDTDGDLGIHAAIDGGAWTSLAVEGPRDRLLLDVVSRSRLFSQGLTQLAFESTEPPFEELAPEKFFARFPEGRYEIAARAQGGGEFESMVRLSHVMPAPAQAFVSGVPAAENCDVVPLPIAISPVVIDWEPVSTSHPAVGRTGAVTISRYQFFVQQGATKLSMDLPPAVTEFTIPTGITDTGGVFKFEIIARGATGNNTAIESCFQMP